MRRLMHWIAGVLGGVIAYHVWKRRPQPSTSPATEETDDRAEELRAKLAESRTSEEPSPVEPSPVEPSPVEPSPVEPSPVEPAPVEPDESPESLEERRLRVHEQGRSAIDEMQGGGEPG